MESNEAAWHFPIMIFVSVLGFLFILLIVMGKQDFFKKKRSITFLTIFVCIFGMLLGKYGAQFGLKWWIYYPVPLLLTLIAPPWALKMNSKKTTVYLFLSFLLAPLIHLFFSFFFGWTEYLPFWKI